MVADNEKELAPTLERLNSVTAMLEKNRDNLAKMLPGAGEILSDTGRNRVERRLLQRAGAQPLTGAASAAVPGLRLRVPARRRCRPAAGQRRAAGRATVPRQQHSAARRPSAAMEPSEPQPTAVTVAAIALAVALVAGAVFLVRQVFFGPNTITAYFPTATSIYPGDEVRVSGVKVGKIESIDAGGHADEDDPQGRPRRARSGRRQGRDRRAEPGRGPLRPAHAGLPERRRPDHARRRGDSQRPNRRPRRMG